MRRHTHAWHEREMKGRDIKAAADAATCAEGRGGHARAVGADVHTGGKVT